MQVRGVVYFMKRYHDEKHIIDKRIKNYRLINAGWLSAVTDSNKKQNAIPEGRYRKTARCGGCGRARCQLCHPEKYPKRKPTRKEIQFKKDAETNE
jgi:hypothetical protein